MILFFSAILITSGTRGGYYQKTAEIYLPSNNTSCSLDAELPEGRDFHTQDGPWACGGGEYNSTQRTCDKWGQGSWTRSHSLSVERCGHVSWATSSGVYLMGGIHSGTTSELVKEDGTVDDGFPLIYDTE